MTYNEGYITTTNSTCQLLTLADQDETIFVTSLASTHRLSMQVGTAETEEVFVTSASRH